MLTRKDFRKAADAIGNIVDYEKRQDERIAYSRDAKEINPSFSYKIFKVWVERVAQEKSDRNRIQ